MVQAEFKARPEKLPGNSARNCAVCTKEETICKKYS